MAILDLGGIVQPTCVHYVGIKYFSQQMTTGWLVRLGGMRVTKHECCCMSVEDSNLKSYFSTGITLQLDQELIIRVIKSWLDAMCHCYVVGAIVLTTHYPIYTTVNIINDVLQLLWLLNTCLNLTILRILVKHKPGNLPGKPFTKTTGYM